MKKSENFKMPSKPGFAGDKKAAANSEEFEALKGKIAFDLDKEFDMKTYSGRFQKQMHSVNPLLFFISKSEIKNAKNEVFKYRTRLEAAKNIESEVFMLPEEIEKMKRYNCIVGGAVHPDTNEIIPFYMKLSGFVVFNLPIVFVVLFTRNQTPLFNAGMQWVN